MSYVNNYVIDIKIKNKNDIEDLYKFCNTYGDFIIAVTYLVKTKTFEIIVEADKSKNMIYYTKAMSEIFKNLSYFEDYNIRYMYEFAIEKLYDLLYDLKLSYKNTRIYLYFKGDYFKGDNFKWNIRDIPKIMFKILYEFKYTDITEIINWFIIFLENYEDEDYENYIDSCINMCCDVMYKTIDIYRYKRRCNKNKTEIPKNVKEYIDYSYKYKGLVDDKDYPYIDVYSIPDVFCIHDHNLIYSSQCDSLSDSCDSSYDSSYDSSSDSCDSYDSLSDLENEEIPIIENNIFNNNNEEEDYDEEYTEIIRSRRIKKNFAISINN